MPYSVEIDKPARTIVIKGTGAGTTADTLRMIRDLKDTLAENAGFNILYDSTELDIDSNSNDMMSVAKTLFEEVQAPIGRLALVVPEVRAELARVFSALAHPYAVTVNVFTNLSDARRWLGIRDG